MPKLKAKIDPPAGGPPQKKTATPAPTQSMRQGAVKRMAKATALFANSLAARLQGEKKGKRKSVPQNRGQKTVGYR